MIDLDKLADRVEIGGGYNGKILDALLISSKIFDVPDGELAEYLWVDYVPMSLMLDEDTPKDFLNSLDAVKNLHDAVLPGWGYRITDPITSGVDDEYEVDLFYPKNCGSYKKGHAHNPAAAWVAAILRAEAGEKTND